MPSIWKRVKTLLSEPVVVERLMYTPPSTATLRDSFEESDSIMYYFYKDDCKYCEEIDAFFKGLPERIIFENGCVSDIELICVNKNIDKAICDTYYELAGIPLDERYVPAVVIGEEYLFAPSEIMENVYKLLLSGKGKDTPMLGRNTRE